MLVDDAAVGCQGSSDQNLNHKQRSGKYTSACMVLSSVRETKGENGLVKVKGVSASCDHDYTYVCCMFPQDYQFSKERIHIQSEWQHSAYTF